MNSTAKQEGCVLGATSASTVVHKFVLCSEGVCASLPK